MENTFSGSHEHSSVVQQLVYVKALDIAAEFHDLFSDEAYADHARWGLVWEHAGPDGVSSSTRTTCALTTLETLCDFTMRILDRIKELRYQLAWLVYTKATVACDQRKRICRDVLALLRTEDIQIKMQTPWKLVYVFQGHKTGERRVESLE